MTRLILFTIFSILVLGCTNNHEHSAKIDTKRIPLIQLESDNPYLDCIDNSTININDINEMEACEEVICDSIYRICSSLKFSINKRLESDSELQKSLLNSVDSLQRAFENSVNWSSVCEEYSLGRASDAGRSSQEMRLCLRHGQLKFIKHIAESYYLIYLQDYEYDK